jgi:hypothetical protein
MIAAIAVPTAVRDTVKQSALATCSCSSLTRETETRTRNSNRKVEHADAVPSLRLAREYRTSGESSRLQRKIPQQTVAATAPIDTVVTTTFRDSPAASMGKNIAPAATARDHHLFMKQVPRLLDTLNDSRNECHGKS